MVHSIVVANGEQEVRQAVLDFQSAGCSMDQIIVIAHENAAAERLLRPRYASRLGPIADAVAFTIAAVGKYGGYAIREKLTSLGLSPSAVQFYEREVAEGRVIVAADVKERYELVRPVS